MRDFRLYFVRFVCAVACVALCVLQLSAQPYDKTGCASFYAKSFDGQRTANGDRFHNVDYTCAHRTLPFGTRLKVTNLTNNKWCVVTVNDRGPFVKGRIIDLSNAAAKNLGYIHDGCVKVRVQEITDDNACQLIHQHDTIVARKFPEDWEGDWCGLLDEFSSGLKTIKHPVAASMSIKRTNNSNVWIWQMDLSYIHTEFEVELHDSTSNFIQLHQKKGESLQAELLGNTMLMCENYNNYRYDISCTLTNDKLIYYATITSIDTSYTISKQNEFVNAPLPQLYRVATLERK